MNWIQIDRLTLQIAQTVLTKFANLTFRVVGRVMNIASPAKLGGDMNVIFLAFGRFGQQLLAVTVSVYIGSIEEVYSFGDSKLKRFERLGVVRFTPCSADGPCTEAHFTYLQTGVAERSHSSIVITSLWLSQFLAFFKWYLVKYMFFY